MAPSFTRNQLKQFLTPVIAAHDPAKVELFFYSADPAAEGELPQGVLRKIGDLSDRDAALAIRRDGVDVLVDLWGHTAGGRLGVFAHRAAPVQISWMNLIQTTGLPAMDYVFHAEEMESFCVSRGRSFDYSPTTFLISKITYDGDTAGDSWYAILELKSA